MMKQQFGYTRADSRLSIENALYDEESSIYAAVALWWMYAYKIMREYHIRIIEAKASEYQDERFVFYTIRVVVEADEDKLEFLKEQIEFYDKARKQGQSMRLRGLVKEMSAR